MTVQVTGMDAILRSYDPKNVEKAHRFALNRTQSATGTQIARLVAKEKYHISQARVNKALTKKAKTLPGQGKSTRILLYVGQRTGLVNFAPTKRVVKTPKGRRRGVAVKIRRGGSRKLVRGEQGGFLAFGRGGRKSIFERITEASGSKLRRLTSLAVPQMVGQVLEPVQEFIVDHYPKELNRQLERLLR